MAAVEITVVRKDVKAAGKERKESGKMVVVSVSETYDLSTKVNKMTLIGVHTPKKELIQKTYPGLCMNSRYFRIKSVDVTLATAQQLPLGVDQIGLDTDKIRPQDMMNPILYKATSNDSFSTLEARLMGMGFAQYNNIKGNIADVDNDSVAGEDDEHGVYYSLLSNRDGWKMSPVQNGVRMKGLVPLVFEKWYTNGENVTSLGDGVNVIREVSDRKLELATQNAVGLRGRPHPMPKINTTYVTGVGGSSSESGGANFISNGMGDGSPQNFQIQMPDIPPVMLGCIILPPATATSGIIYYRMVTRAYIEFTDVRPITEITSFDRMDAVYAPLVYHSDYDVQSRVMDATTNMVDVKNAEIEKIMEGR